MSRSDDPDGLAVLAWAVIATLGLLPVVTLALVAWAPDPTRPSGSTTIDGAFLRYALVEPTDRVVVVSWFCVTALSVLVALIVRRWPSSRQAWVERILVALGVVGAMIIAIGLAFDTDSTLTAPPWSFATLALGAATAGGVLWLAVTRSLRWQGLTVLALLIPGTLYAARLIQLPGKLVDSVNGGYVFGEVLAPGFGHFPLAGFFAQYEHLLGYPIAPLVALFPGSATAIATWWIVLLQAVTLAIACAVAAWASGRRLLWAIIITVPAWWFAVGAAGQFAFSYFAGNPLRTILPVVAIGVACWALRVPWTGTLARAGGIALAGVFSGTAALNNPEFGLPVLAVVVVTASLAQPTVRSMIAAPVIVAVGAVMPFACYWLALAASGRSVTWSAWLLYPSVFSAEGFFNVAMPAIGVHVVVAALFAAVAAVGFVGLRARRAMQAGRRRRLALVLALVGGWSLLTLGYYGGRSLVPTLVGGYALQFGWVMACALPLLVAAWRQIVVPGDTRPSLRVTVVAVAGAAGLALCLAGPWLMTPTAFYNRPPNVPGALSAEVERALAHAPRSVREADARGHVAQAMPLALIVESQTGVPSALAFNNADSIVLGGDLAGLQCARLASMPLEWVLVNWSTARALARSSDCRRSIGSANPVALSLTVAAVPIRRERGA